MNIVDRQKKLDKAIAQLNATRRRIRRLHTAETNWNRRVMYHEMELKKTIAEQKAASAASFKLSLAPVSGRKFRD